MNQGKRTVTVIMTIRNDRDGCAVTLDSMIRQTLCPNEMIIVEAGSTDGSVALIDSYAARHPWIRMISAPGENIARGRNVGIAQAGGEIIATIDAGCRAGPPWLEKIVEPFEADANTEFVGGTYRIDPHTLLEQVAGLATMRGQLEPIDPDSFNPSARSMAFTKDLWQRAGGFPEWVRFSEDTLFDHKIKRLGVRCVFAPDAVVHWRPRRSFRSIARQFFYYGTGRGHTQIDAQSFRYNLRNASFLIVGIIAAIAEPILWPLPAVVLTYFYVCAVHGKARAIARHTGRFRAYPLTILVMWVVQVSHLMGYLVGSWQRWRERDRFVDGMERYMSSQRNAAA